MCFLVELYKGRGCRKIYFGDYFVKKDYRVVLNVDVIWEEYDRGFKG